MIERRTAKRFHVDWEFRVEGVSGDRTTVSGVLRDISSNGALLALANTLSTGAQLEIYIKLPLTESKWMKYAASVVRTEVGFAAVKFDSPRPDFRVPFFAPVQS